MNWVLLLLLCAQSHALYKPKDTVENHCWPDQDLKLHCLEDHKDKVRLLLYSATFCIPCRKKAKELVSATAHLKGKDVVLYQLLCDTKDPGVLRLWHTTNSFSDAKVEVLTLAAFRDCGRDFSEEQNIPAAAVIDKAQRLRSWNVMPSWKSLTIQAQALAR